MVLELLEHKGTVRLGLSCGRVSFYDLPVGARSVKINGFAIDLHDPSLEKALEEVKNSCKKSEHTVHPSSRPGTVTLLAPTYCESMSILAQHVSYLILHLDQFCIRNSSHEQHTLCFFTAGHPYLNLPQKD